MSTNNFKTQIRKGLIEFCVLQIISRGEVYTTDIILELQKSKIKENYNYHKVASALAD